MEIPRGSLEIPEGFALVPIEPTDAQLDRAVAFALNVKLSKEYTWSKYATDFYRGMITAYKEGK